MSKSRIIYNSQKTENRISSYLPHLSNKSFLRVKKYVAKFRLKQLINKLDQSIILSDFELNEEMLGSDNLENILKLVIEEENEEDLN